MACGCCRGGCCGLLRPGEGGAPMAGGQRGGGGGVRLGAVAAAVAAVVHRRRRRGGGGGKPRLLARAAPWKGGGQARGCHRVQMPAGAIATATHAAGPTGSRAGRPCGCLGWRRTRQGVQGWPAVDGGVRDSGVPSRGRTGAQVHRRLVAAGGRGWRRRRRSGLRQEQWPAVAGGRPTCAGGSDSWGGAGAVGRCRRVRDRGAGVAGGGWGPVCGRAGDEAAARAASTAAGRDGGNSRCGPSCGLNRARATMPVPCELEERLARGGV